MVDERQRQRTNFRNINPNDFIDREPYRPREIPNPGDYIKPYNLSSNFNQLDNSGIMLALNDTSALDKLRNIYDQASPYIPDINLNDQTLGYNFNQPFMGGDLSFGYGFDVDDQQSGGYLNWGTDW